MNKKTKIVVVYGGTNTEHEVSIVSARSIIENLDSSKYDVIPIYISKTNQWTTLAPKQAALLPQTVDKTITLESLSNTEDTVIFPVLHGPFGEDGTIQGMLEMMHAPYVGCNVVASAMCMDKVIQKQLCLQQGLPVVPFVWTDQYKWQNQRQSIIQYCSNQLTYPVFVKPANQGSSIGIIKVSSPDKLESAINEAFTYDSKVLIEQGVTTPREIECAILGNDDPKASVLGEIIPSNEFYDYDAKYVDGKSTANIPAKLPPQIATKIQQLATKAFSVMNCSGLARVDFLVTKQYDIYLNELNTMPGFTSISMYPKLWEASGMSYAQLLETLIDLAQKKFKLHNQRKLSFTPKTNWQQS